MLEFNVKNQIITRTDKFDVVADSRNYLTAHFNLSEEWTGDVTAVFGFDGRFYHVVLDENSTCIVPFEVIKTPMFAVSLFCGEESLVTANVATVEVERSGMVEGEVPDTPTPIVWQQYMTAMQELIESGLPYIGDNGNWFLYNTEKGDYEDTGITARAVDGYTPQKGVDYWTDADKAEIKSEVQPYVATLGIDEITNTVTDPLKHDGEEITKDELYNAYTAGRTVMLIVNNYILYTLIHAASTQLSFSSVNLGTVEKLTVTSSGWTYSVSQHQDEQYRTGSSNFNPDDYRGDTGNFYYPSTKCMIEYVESVIGDVETALDNIIAIQNNLMGVSE